MQFLSLASSKEPVQISLKSKSTANNQLSNKKEQDEYITSVIIIDQNTICAISKHTLKFFSISQRQNPLKSHSTNILEQKPQVNPLIGEIRINKEIRELFNKYYDLQEKEKFVTEQQSAVVNQKFVVKETNFDEPCLIKEKGVVYDCSKRQFFIFVSTEHNNYLLTFSVNFRKPEQTQKPSQINKNQQNQKQPSPISSASSIEINNFKVVYNFAIPIPNEVVKYNLEMEPELLYMQQSQTLILIRKFYSDSLVIVFRVVQDLLQTQFLSHSLSTLKRNQSTESQQAYLNLLNKKSSHNKTSNDLNFPKQYHYYWSFYINQECLSLLDNFRYLVNYRQIIAKLHLEIDIIDTLSKEKISIIVRQQIVPMTIKHIQLLPQSDNQVNLKGLNRKETQGEKSSAFIIRIFSVLRNKQASCIMDYDVVHDLMTVYTMENVLIEKISQLDKTQTYCLVNFLYMDKNYAGILRKHLVKQDQAKEEINAQFIDNLIATSVQFEMNSLTWNPQLQMMLQYKISVRNQLMDLKVNTVIDKKVDYVYILDQLKLQNPILQNNQFFNHIFQLLLNK